MNRSSYKWLRKWGPYYKHTTETRLPNKKKKNQNLKNSTSNSQKKFLIQLWEKNANDVYFQRNFLTAFYRY